MSFVAFTLRPFGASLQRQPFGFPRGCARDLLRKPRLPASRAAARHLANPFWVWRVTQQVASDSRDALSRAAHEQGTPSLRPPCVPSLDALGTYFARRVAVASFQSPGARATPPLAPTDARASSRFGALTSKAAVGVFRSLAHRWSAAAPPRPNKIARAICVWAWLRLNTLPPTASR
jgi:hypothetical protein